MSSPGRGWRGAPIARDPISGRRKRTEWESIESIARRARRLVDKAPDSPRAQAAVIQHEAALQYDWIRRPGLSPTEAYEGYLGDPRRIEIPGKDLRLDENGRLLKPKPLPPKYIPHVGFGEDDLEDAEGRHP